MASATEMERLMVRLVGDGSDYKKMMDTAVVETRNASAKIDGMTAKMARDMARPRDEMGRFVTTGGRYKAELANLERLYNEGAMSAKVYDQAVTGLNKEFGKGVFAAGAFGKKLIGLGRTMRNTGMMMSLSLTTPIVMFGGFAAKAFADFDSAMTKSTAIMGNVSEEMREEMEKTAESIAKNTITSAKDAADAYFFLASAGFNAKESVGALERVNKFAIAGMFDMATATDLLTDAQSALGLNTGTLEQKMASMTRVSDVLVKANTMANATVHQFSTSLVSGAGPALKAFNKDIEEGTALLATYADQGIKEARAGEMAGRFIRLLSKSATDNAKAHKKLGFSVFDSNGEFRNMADIVQNLEGVLKGMSDQQKVATLGVLGFEARVQQAIFPLLGASDAMREYESGLRSATGFTNDVAEKQMQSFSSQMKIVWNNFVLLAKDIGNILAPALTLLGDKLKDTITWWGGLSESMQHVIVYVGVAVAAIGPLLAILGMLVVAVGAVTVAVGVLAAVQWALLLPWIPIIAAVVLVVGLVLSTLAVINLMTKQVYGAADAFESMAGDVEEYTMGIRTRFAILGTFIIQVWDYAILKMTTAWGWWKNGVLDVVGALKVGMVKTAKTISDSFWSAVEGALKALNFLKSKAGDAWYALTGRNIGTGGKLGDALKSVQEQKKQAGQFYDDAVFDAALQNITDTENRWMAYYSKIGTAEEEYAKLSVEMDKWRGDLISKEHKKEEAKRKKEMTALPKMPGLPNVETPGTKAMETKRGETEFQQIALNRISLSALSAGTPSKKQEVEATGVENKIEDLIGVVKQEGGIVSDVATQGVPREITKQAAEAARMTRQASAISIVRSEEAARMKEAARAIHVSRVAEATQGMEATRIQVAGRQTDLSSLPRRPGKENGGVETRLDTLIAIMENQQEFQLAT